METMRPSNGSFRAELHVDTCIVDKRANGITIVPRALTSFDAMAAAAVRCRVADALRNYDIRQLRFESGLNTTIWFPKGAKCACIPSRPLCCPLAHAVGLTPTCSRELLV